MQNTYLSWKATEETKPKVHQGEGNVFVKKIAQELAHSEIRPSSMDKQQPLEVSELSKGIVAVQDGLPAFLATDPHTYVGTCKEANAQIGNRHS